jgi:thienamycin biosynthesis protein ThnN
MTETKDRLARVLETHFDPRWGTRYWLERAASLGFDPRKEIRAIEDLSLMGPMPIEKLAEHAVEHFIPRRFHDRLREFVTSETGGTTGPPKRTAFIRSEFEEAFVTPFLRAAKILGFPRGRHWLFVGPSGPHVIGKAARACAVAMGSVDPFSVDFDPRWVRRLPQGSMARERYLEHVLQQAEAILESQDVGVIFATPPVLAALGERVDRARREAIEGIHLGGIAAEPGFWKRLTGEWFPGATAMAGYGNSLAGMCPQLRLSSDSLPDYFPHGERLVLQVISPDASTRGRVCFHRLDESCFLPNVIERDEATSLDAPPPSAGEHGFHLPGIRDPRPAANATEARHGGLY